MMPKDTRAFVCNRDLETVSKACCLAEQYFSNEELDLTAWDSKSNDENRHSGRHYSATTNFITTSGSQAQGSPRTRTVNHPAHLRIPKSQHHSRNIVEARNGEEVETGGGIVRGTPEIPETPRRRDRRRRRHARSARGQVTLHLTVRAGSTRCLTLVDHCHPP